MKVLYFLRRKIGSIPLYMWITLLIFVAAVSIVYVFTSGKFFGNISDFINRHFILPLGHYYTPVNSVVYSVILILAIVLISQLLTRLKVNVDSKFMYSVLPYIFIGSAARALNDSGVFDTILLVSPPIYFVIFGYTLVCLFITLFVRKKTTRFFYSLFSVLGLIPVVYLISLIVFGVGIPNVRGCFLIFAFAGGSSLIALPVIFLIDRFIHFESFSITCLITAAHLLDASATHVAVSYFGYFEQHPLPNLLTNLFGTTLILIPVKFLASILMMIVLDRYLAGEQKQLSGLIKLTILILGLATGTRDLLRLIMLK